MIQSDKENLTFVVEFFLFSGLKFRDQIFKFHFGQHTLPTTVL